MAERTVYIKVRLDIYNPKVDKITDEDVDQVISETDYEFKAVGDFLIESEIYGRDDESCF